MSLLMTVAFSAAVINLIAAVILIKLDRGTK